MRIVYTLLFVLGSCTCGPKPASKPAASSAACTAWQSDEQGYGLKCADKR